MQVSCLLEQIRTAFQYLVEDYGFAIQREDSFPHFANAEVVFQSRECLIRVGRDKDAIYVDVSLAGAPETRWPLQIVVEYIAKRRPDDWYEGRRVEADPDSAERWQIEKLAGVLRAYVIPICLIARQGNYTQVASDLNRILRRLP